MRTTGYLPRQTIHGHQRPALCLVLLILALLLCSPSIFALRRERLVDTWQPTHYEIALTLNDQLSEITSARADIQIIAIKNLSLIDLDFGDLQTDSVALNGARVSFLHQNGKLDIKLPETVTAGTKLQVTVSYRGRPKDGLILKADRDGKPSAVGDNWPDRLHHWIPCFDHPSAKATVTFKVTAPATDIVVANGRFNSVETNASGNRTWTYAEGVPIPPYCMIIGVGDFARIEPIQPTLIPLSYYVARSDGPYALKGFAPAAPALQMFNQTIGPYPYEKLALIIGSTRFGGMENSSAIVFTPTLFSIKPQDKLSSAFGIPESIERVVAHEIAHQWFGDSVTESTWSDLWLSEGFATYFTGLFIQRHDGELAFQSYMTEAAEAAFKYEKKARTPIHDRNTEALFDLLNANNYEKGAWVLHMLRARLGDETFFRAIRSYYQEHKNSIATTEDLREALERASGQQLHPFFRRWVYESGHPQYEVSWQWLPKQRNVRVSLRQLQTGNVFRDPVPIVITTGAGEVHGLITPTSKTSTLSIGSKEKPSRVIVDPNNTLLKEVSNRQVENVR